MSSANELDLGHGFALRCTMDSLDDSVLVALVRGERVLFDKRFGPHDEEKLDLSLPFLRVDLDLWVDAFAGELAASGYLALNPPGGGENWKEVLDVERKVLIRFDPAVGEMGGEPDVHPPVVDHPTYGRSQLCTPAVLRLHVDDGERGISDAGRLVKRELFADRPRFVFNTVACVGEADERGRGAYTNPASRWFNVFLGAYQIDAPRPQWSRPFGYRSAAGAASEAQLEELARLGKADWNYFSNWMYGVPSDAIEPYNAVDMSRIVARQEPAARVGDSLWHPVVLDGMDCVSAYESDAPEARSLVTNSLIDDVWRRAFGLPNPQPGWRESFVATTLLAEVRMAYWEDEAAFHTLIFGATATHPVDRGFLAAQLDAVRRLIETRYPARGFAA